MHLLRRIWELPPREVARRIRRRLFPVAGADRQRILESPKLMRVQRAYDFLSRYEAILHRVAGWTPLHFEGRDVVEVGCWPMLGFGPLAIFRGCRSFTAVDPEVDPTLFNDAAIRERYLLGVYKDLCAIYGPPFGFDEYLRRLSADVRPVAATITGAGLAADQFDIALSNSALEHLDPLAESITELYRWCRPGARFLHLIDFGNHRGTRNPFSGIYSAGRDDYVRRHGRGINLARAPEVLALFREAGFDAGLAPYYTFPEYYEETVAPDWRDRFGDDDLFLKTAILYGPQPAPE
ncbi:MAG: methyltransferase domain-containing protein [Proteobacteria bacterium]|nr:methyltransferase domain-containing protein [Pseudomonadota bacterium]MDA1131884.1 methyltransferase domain-containing protein [Pseudomonadota bacterium]